MKLLKNEKLYCKSFEKNIITGLADPIHWLDSSGRLGVKKVDIQQV